MHRLLHVHLQTYTIVHKFFAQCGIVLLGIMTTGERGTSFGTSYHHAVRGCVHARLRGCVLKLRGVFPVCECVLVTLIYPDR